MIRLLRMVRLALAVLLTIPLLASEPVGVLVTEDITVRVPDGPQDAPGDCVDDCNQCDPCFWRCLKLETVEPGKVTWIQGCVERSLMAWNVGDIAWLRVRILNAYDNPDHPELFKGTVIGEIKIITPEKSIIYVNNDQQQVCGLRRRPVRRPRPANVERKVENERESTEWSE